jgi:N-acetyl-anhydromuramyl-L-alanine amidase AmpD
MPAIQYHYVITPDGKVCWMNEHDDMVWHAQSANEYALGVCLIGDFTDAPPSAVQIAALQELLHHINGVEGAKLQVIGHRDVFDGNTECPGNTWEQWRSQAVAEPKLIETIADPLEQYRKILWWQEEQRRAREKAAELHRQSIQAHVETSDLIERNREIAEELLNYADKIAEALTDKEGAGYHLLDLLAEAKRNG